MDAVIRDESDFPSMCHRWCGSRNLNWRQYSSESVRGINGAHSQSNDRTSFRTGIDLFIEELLAIALKKLKINAGKLGE